MTTKRAIGSHVGRVAAALVAFAGICVLAPRAASAQANTAASCGSGPTADQVYVYRDPNYSGTCGSLKIGLYPYAGSLVWGFEVEDNQMSSIKVGANVRVRVFTDWGYRGNFTDIGPGNYPNMPSGWNDVVSSLRVVDNNRSRTCNDVRPGEFALFRDPNLTGDCVVLTYNYPVFYQTYNVQELIGIANDSVSSLDSGPNPPNPCPAGQVASWSIRLYEHENYGGRTINIPPNRIYTNLSSQGMNDITSSILPGYFCLY